MPLPDLDVRHNDHDMPLGGGLKAELLPEPPWQVPGLFQCVTAPVISERRRRNSYPSCMPPVSFAAVEPIGHNAGYPPLHPRQLVQIMCIMCYLPFYQGMGPCLPSPPLRLVNHLSEFIASS